MMEEKKVISIRIEYSDGSYLQLKGDGAQQWQEYVKEVCVLAHVHNMNPDWASLPWERGQQ